MVYTNRMKRDVKRAKKRDKNMKKFIDVLTLLQNGKRVLRLILDRLMSSECQKKAKKVLVELK